MKYLSEVTFEDAIDILSAAYLPFFKTGRWVLTNESQDLGEPCKKLKCQRKAYLFWFFDNSMDIELTPDPNSPITFDDHNFDIKVACYRKAAELGYFVPAFAALLEHEKEAELAEEKRKANEAMAAAKAARQPDKKKLLAAAKAFKDSNFVPDIQLKTNGAVTVYKEFTEKIEEAIQYLITEAEKL